MNIPPEITYDFWRNILCIAKRQINSMKIQALPNYFSLIR